MSSKLKNNLFLCLMVAIEAIFCFTPLGSIPIGPIVATLSMVPVIITALTFGKFAGMLLGLAFAIFSFIYWTFIFPAHPTAFIFTPFSQLAEYKGNIGSVVICFMPRIIAGYLAGVTSKKFGDIIASIIGSMSHTVFVLGLIFIFFGNEYASLMGKPILYIIEISILTNGIPECVICGILCPIVAKVLRKQITNEQ